MTPRQAAANLAGMLAKLPEDLAFAGRHGKRGALWVSRCAVAGALLADLRHQARHTEAEWRAQALAGRGYSGFDPGMLRVALMAVAGLTGWSLARAGVGWPAPDGGAKRLMRWVTLAWPVERHGDALGGREATPHREVALPRIAGGR